MPWAIKYRPKILDELIGQQNAKDIIRGALKRVKEGALRGSSWLISGSLGCGKTTITRIIAKAFSCHSPSALGEACQVCSSCEAIEAESSHNYLEIDAASKSGVADMRALIQEIQLAPTGGASFRTIALDEAHALTTPAQNALLKSVEHPSPCTHIFFLTTEPEKLLDTIRSRCFRIEIESVDHKSLVDHAAKICQLEGVEYEIPALEILSIQSRGYVRNVLKLAEQMSLAGPLTLAAVRKTLHFELDDRVVKLLTILGLDWEKTVEDVNLLIQDYPPLTIWKSLHRCLTQAEYFRLLPNRALQSEHIKKLVERYDSKLTTAAEWSLSKAEYFPIRTEYDLIVGLSILSEQLGKGFVPIQQKQDKKMGLPKEKLRRRVHRPAEILLNADDFAGGIGGGFKLEESE